MKKQIFLLSLLSLSLFSCGGGDKPEPTPTYTLSFNCTNCKVLDENKKEITSVDITISKPYTTYNKFYLEGMGLYKKPLKSLIKVEKTNKNEEVNFDYNPLTGEILIPAIDNLTITASGINKTLEECTWAEINEISTTGRAREFFDIYDPEQPELNCKKVFLKEDDTLQSFPHTVRIIGFDHDDLADGSGKAGITFEFADLITKSNKEEAYVTKWGETNHDYRNSTLNTFLNDETKGVTSIINTLPGELKGVLKPVNKLVGVYFGESSYIATPFEEDKCPKLFSLAYNEMHGLEGTDALVVPGEAGDPATGAGIYKYYERHCGDEADDKAYRVKNIVGGSGGKNYWIRSPINVSTGVAAFNITLGGEFQANFVNVSINPIAPAFCI